MRILIVTAGSRGDVAPYTGLGVRLRQAGHDVVLAAHDRFADLVRGCGLGHRSLPGDPEELLRRRAAAPSPEQAREVFVEFLADLGDGVVDATAGADVVLTAFGPAPLARAVADAHGVPSAGVHLVPGVPTAAFAPPGRPASGDNLAAGREQLARTDAMYDDVLPRLGITAPPRSRPGPPDGWPIFHGYSPEVLPRPADWPASVQVTGWWWPAVPQGWTPPDQLVEFLAAGPPPVFIGFGSMVPDRERLHGIVSDAVARAGVRAVVQAGWAGLDAVGDDVLVVGDVPHEWLFPRCAAVVHHAGAGTTGAGLRAGVPAVGVPVLVDQPFWADRLHGLGVAPSPLPMADLTAGTLADALRSCPSRADRAAEIGRRIRAEDGAAPVVEHVGRLG